MLNYMSEARSSTKSKRHILWDILALFILVPLGIWAFLVGRVAPKLPEPSPTSTVVTTLKPFSAPFMGSDNIPNISWNEGVANQDTYQMDGCSLDVATLPASAHSQLQIAGTASAGGAVYEFIDPTNPVVTRVYNAYATSLDANGVLQIRPDALSLTSYLAQHGLFVYKNPTGQLILYTNTTLKPSEC